MQVAAGSPETPVWFSYRCSVNDQEHGVELKDKPQEKWSDEIMKFGKILLGQLLILLIQFGSIHFRVHELQEIE